jgi:hypothetical protein
MTGLIFSAAFLTACSTTTPVGLNVPEFGNAVRQNIVAQAVNPNAPEDDGPIEANGVRAANAQAAYEADAVESPAAIATQSTGAAGGGGGGN